MTWAIRTIYSQIGLHVPFYAETMLNQWLYHTINYFEPNTKSKGDGNHPVLVADVTINSLVAWRLKYAMVSVKVADYLPTAVWYMLIDIAFTLLTSHLSLCFPCK